MRVFWGLCGGPYGGMVKATRPGLPYREPRGPEAQAREKGGEAEERVRASSKVYGTTIWVRQQVVGRGSASIVEK